jgi:DNA-3-methyladenine glycosylase II
MPRPGLLFRITMVSTRSASGLSSLPQQTAAAVSRSKRKAAPEPSTAQKKVRPNETNTVTPLAAVLSFDFEEAKQHLIKADARFEDLFSKKPCKPFVHLEQVHPFRWVVMLTFAILKT